MQRSDTISNEMSASRLEFRDLPLGESRGGLPDAGAVSDTDPPESPKLKLDESFAL